MSRMVTSRLGCFIHVNSLFFLLMLPVFVSTLTQVPCCCSALQSVAERCRVMLCVAVRHSALQRVTALCRRCSAAVCALQCVAVLFTPVCVFHVSHIHSKVTFMSPVTNVGESRMRSYLIISYHAPRARTTHCASTPLCHGLQHSESQDSKTHVLRIPKCEIHSSCFISHTVESNYTCWGMPHKIGSCHTWMSDVTHEGVMCYAGTRKSNKYPCAFPSSASSWQAC